MSREEEKPGKENEIQLINLFGRLYDTRFNSVLNYGVAVVEASLNTFLFAGCIQFGFDQLLTCENNSLLFGLFQ